jgi:hypothetical protein
VEKTYYFLLCVGIIMLLVPVKGRADTLELLFMPGDVIKGHAKYEDDCDLCHKPFSKATQRSLCLDCHKKIAVDMKQGLGFHGLSEEARETDCEHCHTDHKGREKDIVRLDRETFDHSLTDFILRGAHTKVNCAACHPPDEKYRDAQSECIDCHKDDDIHHESLGDACVDCHVEQDWGEIKYNHDETDFPLKGKHQEVACNICHPNEHYKETPADCFVCHKLDDDHGGRYGNKCEDCHNSEEWKRSIFDHDKTEFSLEGKHRDVDCDTCHTGILYDEELDTKCFSCHKDDDEHKGRYGKECNECHIPKDWKQLTFDHDKTEFPLKEKHQEVACDACHKGDIYKEELKVDCYSCHALDDIHEGGLGEKCEDCHKPSGWKETTYDHDKETEFPLRDKHKEVECHKCHTAAVFPDKIATTCFGCHKEDDVHEGQEGEECNYCHNEKGWLVNVFFDHDLTRFPLIGLHAAVPCEECHLTTAYKDTSLDCVDCHRSDDIHEQRLGIKCDTCHNPNGWNLWRFDHDSQTEFVLDGAHNGLVCESCHKKKVKKKVSVSTACYSCHFRDDEHRGGFGKHCERCHINESFKELKKIVQ